MLDIGIHGCPESPDCAILDRQSVNSEERISPCPFSSTWNTSMTGDFSALRILHVPSCEMVDLSPSKLVDPLPFKERGETYNPKMRQQN